MKSGLFISLDGIDGCGKSTQCALLADWLRELNHSVVSCRDPGGTPIGQQLRDLLLHHEGYVVPECEALLFMASRAQLVSAVIRPALAEGRIVVSDRFLLANVCYQAHGGGLDAEELWNIGLWAIHQLQPHLTLLLDLPPSVALERRVDDADRLERRDADYHRRVREGFLLEQRRDPSRIRLVDASGAEEEVHAIIRREVQRVLDAHSGT